MDTRPIQLRYCSQGPTVRRIWVPIAYLAPAWVPILFVLLASLEKHLTGRTGAAETLLLFVWLAAAGAGVIAIIDSPTLGVFRKVLLAPAYFAAAFLLVLFVGLFFIGFWCNDVLPALKLQASCPVERTAAWL